MQYITYEIARDRSEELYLSENVDNCCELHFHRNIEMAYILEGEMDATVDGVTRRFVQDEMIFVSSYYSHIFRTERHSRVYILIVPYEFTKDFSDLFRNRTLEVKLDDRGFNREVLKEFRQLFARLNPYNKLVFQGYTDIIMGMLTAHYPFIPISDNRNMNLIVRVLDYIDNACSENITLDSISQTFGYNKYYFSKLFNRFVGESISTYVNRVRVQRIVNEYLEAACPNITELIYRWGFESVTTFYRCFNGLYHCKPKAFFQKLSGGTAQ